MTSFDFAVLITSTWLNQCVQYLRLTSGPKRKNEYNNFCFLRRVEVLEKMFSLAPGPAMIPGLESLSSSLSSSCPTSSCSEAICSSLHYCCRCSDQLRLMPFAFRIEEFSLVVGDVRAFLHAHGERFLVCFQDLHLEVFFYLLCPMFNISGGAAFEKISIQAFLCQLQGGARSSG